MHNQESSTVICIRLVPGCSYVLWEAYQTGNGQEGRIWIGVPSKWGYQLAPSEVSTYFETIDDFPHPCVVQCTSTVPNANFTVGNRYDAKIVRTDEALRVSVGTDKDNGNTTMRLTDIWKHFKLEK